jgi:hypothetical protein
LEILIFLCAQGWSTYAFICLQFYFQNGRPAASELKENCLSRINHLFRNDLDGLLIDG